MFQNVGNISYITGDKGFYDNKIQNSSVRYGRNAMRNYNGYLKKFAEPLPKIPDISGLNASDFSKEGTDNFNSTMSKLNRSLNKTQRHYENMPNIDFELTYMPGEANYQNIDTMAVLGAAFEDLGKRVSVSVQEMTEKFQKQFGEMFTASAFDANDDGKIDIAENATAILMKDALSKNPENLDLRNINGKITNKGDNAFLRYCGISSRKVAKETCTVIQTIFGLKKAQEDFIKDPNNMILG